ncbi:hypothetical protein MK805_00285 [Shimazuella sp. AN120528]|uniref:hypothetical protein n=1 Tax=Shimazuella soli TaxID=1892854 RepID=UPI001F0E73EA|nr:hypothetical protein [Shimazuella soli]MCH5583419.1 hypothetical protein [Shimazuella soli]
MKKLGFIASFLALIFLLATGCTSTKKTNDDLKKNDKPVVVEEKKTPLQVIKETEKVLPTIKAYKFTRSTLEKGNGQTYNNIETGVEQLNPEVAHFTNSRNTEYYYDKQNIYMKKDGQWTRQTNTDGKVLVSVLFTNNIDFLIKNLGTKEEVPGVTVTKNGDEYVVSIDYLIFKDPTMTDAEYAQAKAETIKRKTELTIDANTFEPKKYTFNYESKAGSLRSVELDLSTYTSPIVIPSEVVQSATQAPAQNQTQSTTPST